MFQQNNILLEDELVDLDEKEIIEDTQEEEVIKEEIKDVPQEPEEDNPFKLIAEELGFEFTGETSEDFKKTLKEESKKEVLDEFGLNNPQVLELIEFLSSGGDLEDYLDFVKDTPNISKLSDEQIYKAFLKSTTSFTDTKIEKLVKQAIDSEELEEEAQAAKEHFKKLEVQSKEARLEQQKQLEKAREEQQKQETKLRKDFLTKKEVLGVAIDDTKGFEKYYLGRTEVYEQDGKKYQLTPYEVKLVEIQKNPEKRIEYEMYVALLNYTGHKPNKTEDKNKIVRDLQEKLRGKTTFTR